MVRGLAQISGCDSLAVLGVELKTLNTELPLSLLSFCVTLRWILRLSTKWHFCNRQILLVEGHYTCHCISHEPFNESTGWVRKKSAPLLHRDAILWIL